MAARMRVGTWVRMELPDRGVFVGYTYLDPQHGFSAQGVVLDGTHWVGDKGRLILRLPLAVPWREVTLEERTGWHLESHPAWVTDYYGPQPMGEEWGVWHDHPRLKPLLHPNHPDDLQVIVHEGGPRFAVAEPELLWVRVIGVTGDVFRGRLLNAPKGLSTLREQSEIHFVVPVTGPPVRVTEAYLQDRGEWSIAPCERCQLPELFDPPTAIMQKVLPEADWPSTNAFTAVCGACGGAVVVRRRGSSDTIRPVTLPVPPRRVKPWWRFWG